MIYTLFFRDDIPKLKKKYQNEDFIIISYSLDTSFDSWKQVSINDRINWINTKTWGQIF